MRQIFIAAIICAQFAQASDLAQDLSKEMFNSNIERSSAQASKASKEVAIIMQEAAQQASKMSKLTSLLKERL